MFKYGTNMQNSQMIGFNNNSQIMFSLLFVAVSVQVCVSHFMNGFVVSWLLSVREGL